MFVLNFPKYDKIRYGTRFFPLLLMGLSLILVFIGRLNKDRNIEFIIKISIIGVIIFVASMVFYSVINILNYRKREYMYYGLNNVITKEGKRQTIVLVKIYNYFVLFFGIQFVIIMSILIYLKII